MFVAQRMTAKPIIISPSTTVAEATEIMRNNKIRRLPVVEQGKLVGFLTDRDLREVSPSPATALSIFELNYLLAKMQVKDIMVKKVVTIDQEATIEEAALIMYNQKIGGMPVVNNHGEVVGVITETDIFKTFVDVMGLAEGKTRLTLTVDNKVGVLSDITDLFKECNINISSLVTYSLPDGTGQMVIRADIPDGAAIVDKLEKMGYPVQHIAQIG